MTHRCHCGCCGKQTYARNRRDRLGGLIVLHPLSQPALDLADLPIQIVKTLPEV
jgi:hypothetical protein